MDVATFMEWYMAIVCVVMMTLALIGGCICLYKIFKDDFKKD